MIHQSATLPDRGHALRSLAVLAATAFLLIATSEAGAEPAAGPAERELRAAKVQAAAQTIEAARFGVPPQGDPLEDLARELRATRSALADLASPPASDRAADPTAALHASTGPMRARCAALRHVAERDASLAEFITRLEDRCARLIAAIEEILALPDRGERSKRANALLSEVAAAGPQGRDPLRSPYKPTLRGMEPRELDR